MKNRTAFSLACAVWTVVVTAAEWQYNASTQELTDGDWTLEKVTASGNELTIGKQPSTLASESGTTEIDFSDGVKDYQIVALGNYSFQEQKVITKFVAPRTLKAIKDMAFWKNSVLRDVTIDAPDLEEIAQNAFNQCANVTNLVLKVPNVKTVGNGAFDKCGTVDNGNTDCLLAFPKIETFGPTTFRGCKRIGEIELVSSSADLGSFSFEACGNVTNIVLQCPNLKRIAAYAFRSMPKAESDVTAWDLSSVEVIGMGAFQDDSKLYGTLILPCVTNIGGGAFSNIAGINKLVLGSPDTVVIADKKTISGATRLGDLVLGTTNALPVACEFPNTTNITFAGPAQPISILKTMICGDYANAQANAYKTRFFVSKHQPGWRDLIEPLTEDDRQAEAYQREIVNLGYERRVLGKSREADLGKKIVWFVNEPSIYDPKGLILIVR